MTFPRVLGIEATGVVAACPGGEFPVGQQVVAMMGGMGRTFDGGYAEYTCVPAGQVICFLSDLDVGDLGAVPEMLQTAYGSLTVGLDAQPGQTLLVRGGTSSVGMATAVLAKRRGLTVLATTRDLARADALERGRRRPRADRRRRGRRDRCGPSCLGGVDARAGAGGHPHVARHARRDAGTRGGLLHRDAVQPLDRADFYPIGYLPRGVRLDRLQR